MLSFILFADTSSNPALLQCINKKISKQESCLRSCHQYAGDNDKIEACNNDCLKKALTTGVPCPDWSDFCQQCTGAQCPLYYCNLAPATTTESLPGKKPQAASTQVNPDLADCVKNTNEQNQKITACQLACNKNLNGYSSVYECQQSGCQKYGRVSTCPGWKDACSSCTSGRSGTCMQYDCPSQGR